MNASLNWHGDMMFYETLRKNTQTKRSVATPSGVSLQTKKKARSRYDKTKNNISEHYRT